MFRKILGRKTDDEPKPVRANLGGASSMYFDKEKGRWRERGKEHLEVEEDDAPPPPMAKPKEPEEKKPEAEGSDGPPPPGAGAKKEGNYLDALIAPPNPYANRLNRSGPAPAKTPPVAMGAFGMPPARPAVDPATGDAAGDEPAPAEGDEGTAPAGAATDPFGPKAAVASNPFAPKGFGGGGAAAVATNPFAPRAFGGAGGAQRKPPKPVAGRANPFGAPVASPFGAAPEPAEAPAEDPEGPSEGTEEVARGRAPQPLSRQISGEARSASAEGDITNVPSGEEGGEGAGASLPPTPSKLSAHMPAYSPFVGQSRRPSGGMLQHPFAGQEDSAAGEGGLAPVEEPDSTLAEAPGDEVVAEPMPEEDAEGFAEQAPAPAPAQPLRTRASPFAAPGVVASPFGAVTSPFGVAPSAEPQGVEEPEEGESVDEFGEAQEQPQAQAVEEPERAESPAPEVAEAEEGEIEEEFAGAFAAEQEVSAAQPDEAAPANDGWGADLGDDVFDALEQEAARPPAPEVDDFDKAFGDAPEADDFDQAFGETPEAPGAPEEAVAAVEEPGAPEEPWGGALAEEVAAPDAAGDAADAWGDFDFDAVPDAPVSAPAPVMDGTGGDADAAPVEEPFAAQEQPEVSEEPEAARSDEGVAPEDVSQQEAMAEEQAEASKEEPPWGGNSESTSSWVMLQDPAATAPAHAQPVVEEKLAEAGAEALGLCTEELHPTPQDALEELFGAPPAATGPEEQRPIAEEEREAEEAVMPEAGGPTAQELELQRQLRAEREVNRALSERATAAESLAVQLQEQVKLAEDRASESDRRLEAAEATASQQSAASDEALRAEISKREAAERALDEERVRRESAEAALSGQQAMVSEEALKAETARREAAEQALAQERMDTEDQKQELSDKAEEAEQKCKLAEARAAELEAKIAAFEKEGTAKKEPQDRSQDIRMSNSPPPAQGDSGEEFNLPDFVWSCGNSEVMAFVHKLVEENERLKKQQPVVALDSKFDEARDSPIFDASATGNPDRAGAFASSITEHDGHQIKALMTLLEQHTESLKVCSQVCEAIESLTFTDNGNRTNIVQMGGVEAVIGMLRRFKDSDGSLLRPGMDALWNLTFEDEAVDRASDAGAPELVGELMRAHLDVPELQAGACAVLLNLAVREPNRWRIVQGGAAGLITAAMKRHENTEDVLEQGCQALYMLAYHPDLRPHVMASHGAEAAKIATSSKHVSGRAQKWGKFLQEVLDC